MGAKTKSEREVLTARREGQRTEDEARKKSIAERVRSETQSDIVHQSRELIKSEKSSIGNLVRAQEAAAVEKRNLARQRFLQQMAENRREVDSIKSGAKVILADDDD
jgi:hypothetical protein